MPRRFSTRHSYKAYIDNHILPKWRDVEVNKLTPETIQMWLNAKTRKDNGQPLSGKTKGHIRALMQILFDRAMFWGYLPIARNPMELVKIKGGTRRSSRPNVLSPEQLELLLDHIQEDYVRLVVVTSICLGAAILRGACTQVDGHRLEGVDDLRSPSDCPWQGG
jgi:integrase